MDIYSSNKIYITKCWWIHKKTRYHILQLHLHALQWSKILFDQHNTFVWGVFYIMYSHHYISTTYIYCTLLKYSRPVLNSAIQIFFAIYVHKYSWPNTQIQLYKYMDKVCQIHKNKCANYTNTACKYTNTVVQLHKYSLLCIGCTPLKCRLEPNKAGVGLRTKQHNHFSWQSSSSSSSSSPSTSSSSPSTSSSSS